MVCKMHTIRAFDFANNENDVIFDIREWPPRYLPFFRVYFSNCNYNNLQPQLPNEHTKQKNNTRLMEVDVFS